MNVGQLVNKLYEFHPDLPVSIEARDNDGDSVIREADYAELLPATGGWWGIPVDSVRIG